MKKIVLLVPFFHTEYSMQLVSGIAEFFKDKPVKLIIAKTEFPKGNNGLYDYQYWNLTEFVKTKEIDAYIIASAFYCNNMSKVEVENFVKTLGNKPIISIGEKLNLPNSYTVTTDCNEVYDRVIKHLKEKHGCKTFAFMSANGTKSEEALARFAGYKKALKNNGLAFNKDLVFEGNFTDFNAKEYLEKHLRYKEEVTFDALVAANDMMALGSIQHLESLGVNVPRDVKVVGYDNSDVAFLSRPKLSSINQDVKLLGNKAAQVTMGIIDGLKMPKTSYSELDLVYRQSCGCISVKVMRNVYFDRNGVKHSEEQEKVNNLSNYMSDISEKNNIITLMDMVKSSNTIRQFYYNFSYIVPQSDFEEMTLNLFDDPILVEKSQKMKVPKEMEMYMYSDERGENKIFKPGIRFSPKKTIFSADNISDEPGIYMLYPIFSAEQNYGYLIAKTKHFKFMTYNVYLKILGTAISQACEYTRTISQNERLVTLNSALKMNNDTLVIRNRTDELTGILNRHGFMEEGQRTIDIMQENDSAGIVFFADMDNLKTINDTYGHKMGDRAIQLQAKALRRAFRSTDVIGRLSGDEFGIIAVGVGIEYLEFFREKVKQINIQISKEENLDFELSISLGGVNLEGGSVLNKLLSQADKELYIQKRIKKGLDLDTK